MKQKTNGTVELPEELRSPTDDEFRQDLRETLYASIFALEGAKDGLIGDNKCERISDPEAKAAYERGRAGGDSQLTKSGK